MHNIPRHLQLKNSEMIKSFQSNKANTHALICKYCFIFFHPDYTVGFGISPNHTLRRVGCTTGREFNPALKIVIQLLLFYHEYLGLSMIVFGALARQTHE